VEPRLRVIVDSHRCIGAGNCIAIAPTAFKWKNDEPVKAEPLDVESVDEEVLREAALTCPTYAIIIHSTDQNVERHG
jgi:ferredoxin